MLQTISKSPDEVITALTSFSEADFERVLTAKVTRGLKSMLPDESEVSLLASYLGDIGDLAPADQFMVRLIKVAVMFPCFMFSHPSLIRFHTFLVV